MGKKAPKSTPRTTAINPQAVAHTFTAFSPLSDKATPLYYAHLHAAPDAHTLRVYSIDGKCVSRWASNAHGDEAASHGGDNSADEPRVRCIEWCSIPAAAADEAVAQQQAEGKRGKKRRKSDGGGAVDSPAKPTSESLRSSAASSAAQLLLALGLENGSILLWQPRGTQARTLSHPASNSPVTALAAPAGDATTGHLWSAHHDGSVRVWDLESGNVIGKVAGLAEESRWDDLLVRYEAPAADSGKRTVQLVLSHLSLHVYTVQVGGASKKEGKVRDLKATELGRCTGHVEPCSIRWTGSSSASSSAAAETDKLTFLSYAPMDRFVQVWQIPTTPASSAHIGLLLARLALDSGVASASVSPLAIPTLSSQTLAAVDSATGNVSLTTLPVFFSAESATPSKKGKKHGLGVVALDVQCEITAPAQGGRNEANVSEVAFRPEEDGKAILCRGGVKPVFEVVAFKEEGSWISKIELTRGAQGLLTANGTASSSGAPQTSRYSEQSTSAVAATAVAADADSDDDEVLGNAGELDVDMAEPTLADRLKALNVSQKKERKAAARKQRAIDADDDDVEVASESDDDDEEEFDLADEDDDLEGRAVPATTLTTTLIQALHSQDGPLLESCLTHSNPNLVRSTVKRLPSGGLVLSLLEALVERLGRQKKGREGLASVERARALIAWLRETLVVHVGFLVTIPSLVNRLAALHASLTQRLALQPTLLALNGRLDLVMSQIDLRQDRARAASRRQQLAAASAAKKPSSGRRYVEGESTDEDEPHGDDDDDLSEGDVEDVVLGAGGSDDDEDSSDVDSDFLDEEDGEGGAPRHKRNGVESLLDLEAEDDEDFDEDEDEDDVSDDDDDDENAGEDSDFEA